MTQTRRPPNFVLIVCDDLGYSDIEPYGGTIPTPGLNRMAAEGLVATDYYAPANICTPSRAGMLTGRYAIRSGLAFEAILYGDDRCLPLSEKTIAEALRPAGYVSGLFGKWHLGHTGPDWLPTKHGFDTFFGIPFSHDILPLTVYEADAGGIVRESEPEFPMLQQQFYAHAERFIEDNRERPFFVELALSAPHLPEYPQGEFKGSSDAGPYGDVVREIDAIAGRLLDKLRELQLERDTVVFFTSDNGPWFEGSCNPLRDRKGGTAYDGGFRVPFIAWAPGRIAASSKTDAIICGIDFLPTFCDMAGVEQPAGVEIDGRDISGVLTAGAPTPHEEIVLFNNERVVGVRTQRWKYVSHAYYRSISVDMEQAGYAQLYDMTVDVSESYSVAATYPDVAADMRARVKRAADYFGQYKRGVPRFFRELIASGGFQRRD